jgi:hypothetical protein
MIALFRLWTRACSYPSVIPAKPVPAKAGSVNPRALEWLWWATECRDGAIHTTHLPLTSCTLCIRQVDWEFVPGFESGWCG